MLRQYSLDLETFGKGPLACIVAIGCVEFCPTSNVILDRFYTPVDAESSVAYGGQMDASTVLWWLKQSEEAREAITVEGALPIQMACVALSEWMAPEGDHKNVAVWGNGAVFDNVIMASAYRNAGIIQPWIYKHDMCGRTLRALRDLIGVDVTAGAIEPADAIAHHALHDAEWLAGQVMAVIRRLRVADLSYNPCDDFVVPAKNEVNCGSELAESVPVAAPSELQGQGDSGAQ